MLMDRNIIKKSVLAILIVFSIWSALYLQLNDPTSNLLEGHHGFVGQYIKEKSYLPEVKFVKELLRTIFNVVNL